MLRKAKITQTLANDGGCYWYMYYGYATSLYVTAMLQKETELF